MDMLAIFFPGEKPIPNPSHQLFTITSILATYLSPYLLLLLLPLPSLVLLMSSCRCCLKLLHVNQSISPNHRSKPYVV